MRKCECGARINFYLGREQLGECMDCHRLYVDVKDVGWVKVGKAEFKYAYDYLFRRQKEELQEDGE